VNEEAMTHWGAVAPNKQQQRKLSLLLIFDNLAMIMNLHLTF
jgi:hypothetical protein